MNAVTERMQRAQQCLERAAHLEGTGQPKVCADYVRRAGELIEEARTLVAEGRGPEHATRLANERAAQLLLDSFKEAWGNIKTAFRPFIEALRAAQEVTQKDYVLAGPSKGGGR